MCRTREIGLVVAEDPFAEKLALLTPHRSLSASGLKWCDSTPFVDLVPQVFHPSGKDLEAVGKVIEKCVNFLVEDNTPHTVVFTTGRVFLLPRQHLEPPPWAVVPGFPEVSGEVRTLLLHGVFCVSPETGGVGTGLVGICSVELGRCPCEGVEKDETRSWCHRDLRAREKHGVFRQNVSFGCIHTKQPS